MRCRAAFTLVELALVLGVLGVVAALLLPALARTRERTQGIVCLNNTKQLALAWQVYAADHEDRLPYNLGMNGTAFRTNLNWVNNVMTWDLSPDNTNLATITEASLGLYTGGNTALYRCPSDRALSRAQIAAGWPGRIRSYSMNAMVGDAGHFSEDGFNIHNPDFKQFFRLSDMPHPDGIFVFLDEHPDSINDGYFLNRVNDKNLPVYRGLVRNAEWLDLPASYHHQGTALAFADGHSTLHHWTRPSTIRPPLPHAAALPILLPAATDSEQTDFKWLARHMSVEE